MRKTPVRKPHSEETRRKIAEGLSKTRQSNPTMTAAQREGLMKAGAVAKANRDLRKATSETDVLGRKAIRERIAKEQGDACLHCGLTEWMGGKIPLELDHEDGNNQNNSRANLRMLCPNCHALTPTWRKAKKHPLWKVVPPAGIEPASQV